MSGLAAFEGELNSVVREYLEHINFRKTLATFENECTENGKPIAPMENRAKGNQKMVTVQTEMMQLFARGKRKEFLRLWTEYLSPGVRDSDPVSQKLEFYAMVYFATYALRQGKEGSDENMEAFKKYLETRGAALSQTPEFLQFYALPFIPNIRNHPSYKDLFSDNWVPDLEAKINKFLSSAFQSGSHPHLFDLYNAARDRQQTKQPDQRIVDAEGRLASYQRKCKQLQVEYQNIISITADLVDTLEATVHGELVSADYLQKVCERLFSTQVRQTVDLTRPGTASAMLRQSALPPQGLQHHDVSPAVTLDYDKIKYDLVCGEERKQAILLQALRWKLSKVPRAERDAMMAAYVKNDLLGCTRQGPHRQAVLNLLLAPPSDVVQQYTTRLLNAFSSLSVGRSYLCQNPSLVPALIETFKHSKIDSLTCENALGALQKLSLRRQVQTLMIDENIVAWLVQLLEDNDALSDYTLEYSIALLMNLCLRTGGKRKCVECAQQVLKVLIDLLGHDNKEIIPYVNGALYSVLAISSIRNVAKSMGMEDILRCFLKPDQPDMNRQVEFIIKQLNSTTDPTDADSDDEEEEDEEEDQDVMEADLDKNEAIKPQPGELYGDRLLNSYYVQTSGGGKKKRPVDGVSAQDGVLSRPVTPGILRGATDANAVVFRPPTGKSHHGSALSARGDIQRPPTRSGSRPNSAQESFDSHSSSVMELKSPDMPSRGENRRNGTSGTDSKVLKPSTKAMEKLSDQAVNLTEYGEVFGTRSRIPRTPDLGAGRPTSRGTVSEGPPPQPKYSESLPTPRPNSEGKRIKSYAVPSPQHNALKATASKLK